MYIVFFHYRNAGGFITVTTVGHNKEGGGDSVEKLEMENNQQGEKDPMI